MSGQAHRRKAGRKLTSRRPVNLYNRRSASFSEMTDRNKSSVKCPGRGGCDEPSIDEYTISIHTLPIDKLSNHPLSLSPVRPTTGAEHSRRNKSSTEQGIAT
jgi:hypothetical protein